MSQKLIFKMLPGKVVYSDKAVSKYTEFGSGALEHASNLSQRLDPSLTWEDVRWLRQKLEKAVRDQRYSLS